MRNTSSKSEDAVTIRALASQRQIKPVLSLSEACQACALASQRQVRSVLSPPWGMSGLCPRLSKACQACALASQRHVKPVLSPPKGRSGMCSRIASPKGANVHNRWCSERSERNLRSPRVWDDRPRRGRT